MYSLASSSDTIKRDVTESPRVFENDHVSIDQQFDQSPRFPADLMSTVAAPTVIGLISGPWHGIDQIVGIASI
jgi:hypothetical protein